MNVLRFCYEDYIICITDSDIPSADRFLTKNQKDFATAQLSGSRKVDFLRSRALLNFVAGELLDFSSDPRLPHQIPDCQNPPTLQSVIPGEMHGKFYVSLSHKKNLAAVIGSKHHHYGIDIEFVKPTTTGLRDRVLTARERNQFSSEIIDTLTAFSFKEAVFKSINRKYKDLRSFSQCEILEVKDNIIYAKVTEGSGQGLELVGSIFRLKNLHGNYIITVARPK